jgi:hypothetical protein
MKELAAKIVAVMDECRYVQKTGKNTFHGYKYATAADVLDKVNAALVKHKIAVVPTVEITDFKDVTNAKGNTEHLATVKTTLTLIDADSGQTAQAIGFGSGQDIGDKAIMKAQTASLKYTWMLFLQISTGDDPEADDGVDKRSGSEPQTKQTTQPTGQKPAATQPSGHKPSPAPSSKPAATNQPTQGQQGPQLNQTMVDKFYSIVATAKATEEEIKAVQDHAVPGKRLPNGKFDWNHVSKIEYETLCNLFLKGTWKNLYSTIKAPSLAAGGTKL